MAAEGLGDRCVARVAPVWACLSESAEGGVDDVWLELLQLLVAEAEALHGAGGEVLDYDVGFLHEVLDEGDPLRLLHVDGDVLLVHVEGVEGAARPLEHLARAEASYVAPRGFDCDDFCAEFAEHHGAVWAEPDVGEV